MNDHTAATMADPAAKMTNSHTCRRQISTYSAKVFSDLSPWTGCTAMMPGFWFMFAPMLGWGPSPNWRSGRRPSKVYVLALASDLTFEVMPGVDCGRPAKPRQASIDGRRYRGLRPTVKEQWASRTIPAQIS